MNSPRSKEPCTKESSAKVCAIAAMDEGRVIGDHGKLPWHIPEDMKRFSELTRGHTVLMGRATYESLPPRFRPLPHRVNVVASRGNYPVSDGVQVVTDAVAFVHEWRNKASDILWIIGGAQIYAQTLNLWDELFLTVVHSKYTGDAFFPSFESQMRLEQDEPNQRYSFRHYIAV